MEMSMDRKIGGMLSGVKRGDGAYEKVIHGKHLIERVAEVRGAGRAPQNCGRQRKAA
jgi:hypothetical protein